MKQLSICLLLIFTCLHTAYGSINFSVTTDRTHAMVGEQVIITAKVVCTKGIKNIAAPSLPPSEYYALLRTSKDQQQSTSIQIINGKMTQTKEITYLFYYFLTLKKEGTFTFPALAFKHDGKSYSSKPFSISIGKEQVKKSARDLFVNIRTNKKRMYVGEQGILSVNIAKKANAPVDLTNKGLITVVGKIEETFGKNFSVNRLFTDKIAQVQRNINGQIHHVFSLSFSIIPLKPGSYTLQSIPFEYHLLRKVQRRRDLFDDFFGGSFFGRGIQRIAKTTYSNRLSINVLALPPQPDGFSGAVGTFKLNAGISQNKIPAGEAVTLNITLKGSTRPGNMADIKLPDLPDFEIFTPEKHTYIDTSARGISTRKKFKYLIIPREEGEKTIPSIQWTYFDPDKGAYKTLSTEPILLTVTKGKKGAKRQMRYLTQEDIREIGRDIRYLKIPARLKHQSAEPHKNPIFFVLFPITFLIALFALLYRLQATVLKKEPSILLKKRALHTAKVAFKKLNKESTSLTPAHAVSRIAEIIETYISHRFGFAAIGKTLEELKEELAKLNVEQSVTDTLVPFLEKLDSYRFGRNTPDKKTLPELLEKTLKLIKELERKEKKA